MNAETDAYYGRPDPSRTYKWGLVLPGVPDVFPLSRTTPTWRVVCWFPTRKKAEAYAKRVHGKNPWAIARSNLADHYARPRRPSVIGVLLEL
jgi:hypothetical protein